MKFRFLYTFMACLFAAGISFNFQSGPASASQMDRTGSPIQDGAFCGQCHTAGAFNPAMEIQLLSNGTPVTKYKPGVTYQVEISIIANNGMPGGYGFQAVALDGNNAGQGTFANLPADVKITELNGVNYVEQGRRLDSNVLVVDWTAPDAGSGDVTIYAGGVAVDGNNGNSQDGSVKNSLTLPEDDAASTFGTETLRFDLILLQNPIQDILPIEISSSKNLSAEARMVDLNGRVVMTKPLQIMPGEQTISLETGDLDKGIYFFQIADGQSVTTRKVLKL